MNILYHKLKDCCSKIGSGATPKGGKSVYTDEGVSLIRSQNVYNLSFAYKGLAHITDEAAKKLSGVTLQENDILLNITGDSVARTCVVPNDVLPARVNQHVAIIRPNKSLDPIFLNYYLASPAMQGYLLNIASTGASRNAITKAAIEKLIIPAPTIDEQHKIASLLSSYNNLIENNNKRIKILEQMAENLYKEWFVRFRFPGHETTPIENGIPKGWEVKKIKDCVKRLPFNQTYKANELEPEGKIIVVDQSADAYIGFHNNEPSHKANIESPILLFGDHSCKFVLMIKDFSLGENIVPFTSINADWLNPYYLFYATHKIIETTEYKRHWGQFVSMKILVPSSTLQQKFSDFMKSIHKELDELFIANRNLIKQRDLLLPRLMSGKLEVK